MDASLACMAVDWMKTLHQNSVSSNAPSCYDGVEIVSLTENGDMAMLENMQISLHLRSSQKAKKKRM